MDSFFGLLAASTTIESERNACLLRQQPATGFACRGCALPKRPNNAKCHLAFLVTSPHQQWRVSASQSEPRKRTRLQYGTVWYTSMMMTIVYENCSSTYILHSNPSGAF